MRNRLFVWAIALAVLLPLAAAAADVTGKWKAVFTTPDGTERTNTFISKPAVRP